MDWKGEFRGETNTLFGYAQDATSVSGYAVKNNNDSPANFQNLFFSLRPRVLVNDNVSIHSNLWFNSPDSGFFGSNTVTNRTPTYHGVQSGTGTLTAREFFAEVATDFGTFRVGRVPLHYGLGLVWNSEGGLKSRLPSNGDAMTLNAKFGALKLSPGFVKYQQASVVGGSMQPLSGISDYSLGISYSNDDEQLDIGLLFLRRLAGQDSGVVNPFFTDAYVPGGPVASAGYAYNIWDFYAKKRSGIFTVAAEVPIASGIVASQQYSTVAGAVKASAAVSDHWKLKADVGSASGQGNAATNKLTAFYFHPDYRPGFLMFNYNYQNIANGTGSYYDQPVTNARFFSFAGEYSSGKFSHEFLTLIGFADQVADGANNFFNTQLGRFETATPGITAQGKNLGFELDYGLGYDWDEFTRFALDLGLYVPGSYYDFNNTATPSTHKSVFGTHLSMAVKF
ncbi:MAG: hypothetical protein EBX52_00050 [Proteobacteria bacterium]|nr:hypothetical protein [Pseudomonadota bacterium]